MPRPLPVALTAVTACAGGPFTLVMERGTDGWKILHDHTASN